MVGGHRIKVVVMTTHVEHGLFFNSGTFTFHNITQLREIIAKTQLFLACLLRGKISLVSLAYRVYNSSVIIS